MPKRPNQPNSPFCPGSKELTARLTYNDFDYNSCVAAAADMANTRQTLPLQCSAMAAILQSAQWTTS